MLPFTSLDEATSTGPGEVKDLETSLLTHTYSVIVAGSPTSVTVRFEASHDGVNWSAPEVWHLSEAPPWSLTFQFICRYVRANLVTLSGGTNPAVTVTIASA